jgi:hypothetical protein
MAVVELGQHENKRVAAAMPESEHSGCWLANRASKE